MNIRHPIGLRGGGHFPQKSPIINGSFPKNHLQLNASHWSSPRCTGWRRPIGCLKLQVIFHKRATNYKALLRKMTYKDKAYYDSTPPFNNDGNLVIHVSICKWVISHIWKMTYKDKAYYDSTPPCNNEGNPVIRVSTQMSHVTHMKQSKPDPHEGNSPPQTIPSTH